MSFDPDELLSTLRGLPAAHCYWVGFSGGLDSSVLLQALVRIRGRLGAELRAIHVNHHIQRQSDEWQRHCVRVCASLNVACECRELTVQRAQGESLEAVARQSRYAAYQAVLRSGDLLLLAHHQDDQLETFLLQMLRGAGLRGLAAMPAVTACGKGQLGRPLLGFTRAELQAWAVTQGFNWLEDPSNADTGFDRNYLRQRVIPLLRTRWPAAAETVSRGAQHCAEAMQLLADLATDDLNRCAVPGGDSLAIEPLKKLSAPRAKNLLRHWLEQLNLPPPPARKLQQVFAEVLAAGADRNPCVTWKGAELRRYRQRLYALPPLPVVAAEEFWLHPGADLSLGAALGVLSLQPVPGEGLRAVARPANGFRVRFRAGGEVCRPAGRAHRRPLKKWLQDYGVRPWMRARLPLIYAGEELAAVAGLFVCASFAANDGEPGLRIHWRAHPRLQE